MSFHDDDLICYKTPGSLQNYATVTLAAYLWRLEFNRIEVNGRSLGEAKPKLESIIQGQLPESVKKIIETCVECVKEEWYHWTSMHYVRACNYYDPLDIFIFKYFHLISWKSNYHIDYNQTAKNLLASPNLEPISKYKLACWHCFEDDIKNIWPEVHYDQILIEYMIHRYDLCTYWYRRMEKEYMHEENDEIDMLENYVLGPITISSSLTYLFNRLNPETQVECFVRTIEKKISTPESIKLMLPLFTEMQLGTIIERCGVEIIRSLVCGLYENDADYTLRVWRHVRNVIPGADFFRLLKKIVDRPRPIFYDIWSLAPEHLKNYISNHHTLYLLLVDLYQDSLLTDPNMVKSIKELISRADPQILKRYWRDFWFILIKRLNLADLMEFMKHCFENDQDIAEFKRTHLAVYNLRVEEYFFNLIRLERFDEMTEFLNFCSPDTKIVEDLKKRIVQSDKCFEYLLSIVDNPQRIRSFLNFANDVRLSDDGQIGSDIFMYFSNLGFITLALQNGSLDSVKKLASLLIPETDAKATMVKYCHSALISGELHQFDVKKWDEFLLWCLDDDRSKLDEFKLSLPVDDIFRILLEKSFGRYREDEMLRLFTEDEDEDDDSMDNDDSNDMDVEVYRNSESNVSVSINANDNDGVVVRFSNSDHGSNDEMETSSNSENEEDSSEAMFDVSVKRLELVGNFLLWYFRCQKKIKEFKMKKIEERDVSSLRDLLASDDEECIEIVLDWFFDGDYERIEVFESSLRDSN